MDSILFWLVPVASVLALCFAYYFHKQMKMCIRDRLGANAVIGVDLDYETVGGSGSMLMVTANGTAVTIED